MASPHDQSRRAAGSPGRADLRARRNARRRPHFDALEGRQLLAASILPEFPIDTPASGASGITLGPDGALWFTEPSVDQIGEVATDGTVTEYTLPTADALPTRIVAGPGNVLYFTEQGADQIGRIDLQGNVTEFPLPTANASPTGITLGPDGNIWFTELAASTVGKITPQGIVTDYALPTANAKPTSITTGPDGALWFTENGSSQIGRISPATGAITEYSAGANANPDAIAAGPDGALYFTNDGSATIGRISTSGTAVAFNIPSGNAGGGGIVLGPNSALYFTEASNAIGEIVAGGGTITETSTGVASLPADLAVGPDDLLYYTDPGVNGIGRADLQIPTVSGYQVTGRAGSLSQITISFGGPLTTASAQDIGNYTLSASGRADGQFDTGDQIFAGRATDRYLHLKSAVYNSSNNTVTLTTSRPLSRRRAYRLRLSGEYPTGLAGPSGNTLVGNGAVTPGNYLDIFFTGYTRVAKSATPVVALSLHVGHHGHPKGR